MPQRRLVAYVRVSKGREDMISPDIQLDAIQGWAARHDAVVVKVIQDLSKSGRQFEKRAIPQMIEEIKADEYDTVGLWKWSRWGRNSMLSGSYLVQVEAAGGNVVSATEDIDPATIVGRFTRTMLLGIAEMESDMKSEGWKETHDQRRKNALPHNGAPRYGYQYGTVDGNKMYRIDPATGPILADLYRRYIKGTSLRSLTMDMNAKGQLNLTGNLWTPQSLGYMLDTGFAAGLIRERSDKAKKTKSKALANFDIWRDGSHDPIITRDEWQSYRDRRLDNRTLPPRSHRAAHALSGLIYCGTCDTRMVVAYSGANSEWLSWRCKKRADQGLKGCRGLGISDRKAQRAVLDWIESEAQGEWQLDVAISAQEDATARVDVAVLQERIESLTRQQDRLVGLYERDAIDDATFDRRKQDLDEQGLAARIELRSALAAQTSKIEDPRPTLEALAKQWKEILTGEKKNLALRAVVGKAIVNPETDGERLRIVPLWEV